MIRSGLHHIPAQKRDRLIKAASKEFAVNGFHKANVNIIAMQAGISVGSIYNYFDSKEDLYAATFQYGYGLLSSCFEEALALKSTLPERLRTLFVESCRMARRHPYFMQLYLNLASGGVDQLTKKHSEAVEKAGSAAYAVFFQQARENGELGPNFDPVTASFVIDNNLFCLAASFGSTLFRIRQREYLGQSGRLNDAEIEQIVDKVLDQLFTGLDVIKVGQLAHPTSND